MKKKLIVIAGPTASGKTAVSVELAKQIGGEIISADSMQVYKYMDIGSAKITEKEKEGITHYLVDELEPSEPFSVNRFQQMAKEALKLIYSKGKIPILCGGTGFYIQSVVKDIDFNLTDEEALARKQVTEYYQVNGKEALYQWLEKIDPKSATAIHQNNIKRVMRAVEYYLLTSERISDHNEREKEKESPYDVSFNVLTMERELLYQRIEDRVDKMLENGLLEEVIRLKEMGFTKEMTSMQGLGYKEVLRHLEGEYTMEEAVYRIKRDTRHFAKRQLTWFRREKEIRWINVDHYDFDRKKVCENILQNL